MSLNRCDVWSFLVALSYITGIVNSGHYGGSVEINSGARQASTNFECKEEGYHADPSDCKLYYRCVDWGQSGALTKFKFECGPGTVFSKQRGDICTHPNDSGRSECGGSDENEETNDVDSNNTYDPVKEEQSNSRPNYPYPTNKPSYGSSSGPLYGPPSGPSYVPSSGPPPRPTYSPPTAGTRPSPKPISNWSTQQSGSVATTRITDGTNEAATEATTSNDCQADGFLADPQDCSKFYRCVDQGRGSFKKHEFKCGEGTVWDPQIEACNHPWAANRANCKTSQPGPAQQGQNNEVPYQTGPNSNPNGSSLAPPPPCQTQTPPLAGGQQGTVPGTVPTPKPSKQPTSGVQQPQTTVPGTVPMPSPSERPTSSAQQPQGGSQQGSSPSNEVSQPSGTTPSRPQPTAGPNGEPQQPDSSKPGSPPLSKDEACSSEGFFGDADDCTKFYRCVNSGSKLTKYEFKCGDGTVWDDRIASCNHKYAVPKCGGSDQGTGGGNQQPDGNNNEVGTDQENGNGNEGTGDINNEIGTDQGNGNGNDGADGSNNEIGQRPGSGSSPGDSTSSPSQTPSPTAATTSASGVEQGSTNAGETGTTVSTGATENSSQGNPSQGTTPNGSDSASTSEKPSSTGTSGNGECTAEGFFPDPADCSKFYRCVSSGSKFTKYEFTCGEGTVWDERITSCNHKSAVPRCGGADQGNGGGNQQPNETDNEIGSEDGTGNGNAHPGETDNEIGHGPDSESSPLEPASGSGQPPGPTGETTESSKVTEASTNSGDASTLTPSSTEATGDSSSSSAPDSSESPTSQRPSSGGSPGDSSSSGAPDSSESSTLQKPSPGGPSGKGQCTKEGFFPDPEDCKKFYRCVAGEGSKLTKYEFTCGEGTAWDDKIQSCNHAYAVPGCGAVAGPTGEQPPDESSPSSGSTGESGEGGQEVTNTKPESSSSEPTTMGSNDLTSTESPASPEQGSQEPSSTTQDSGESSESTSEGENKIPNEASSTTPPPSQSSENTTPTGENELPSEPSSTTQSTSPASEGTTPTSETEPPSGSSSTTPSSGQSSEATTPDDVNQVPTEPSSTTEPSSPPSTDENEIPSESQTSSSPAPTTSQAPQSTTSESSNNGQSGSSGECNEEGFFPNKNDCHKFYRCVAAGRGRYTKYEFSCGPGTAWDQNLLTCNYIHLVQSCGAEGSNEITDEKNEGTTSGPGSSPTAEKPSGSSPNEPSSTENNVPSSGKPAEVTMPAESTSESSSESTSESSSGSSETTSASSENGGGGQPCNKPEPTGIVCKEAGFNAHPTQCGKFYRCVDNGNGFNVYHFDCAPGTIFDPSISVCNYPESVYPPRNCQDTKPASPSGSTTESSEGQGSSTGSTESSEGSPASPTSTEAISTTGKGEETATSTEPTVESTSEETGSEAPVETTEAAGQGETTEVSGGSSTEVTTDGAGESTTENAGETSEETQSTTGQEESTTSSSTEAEATTESQEGTATEAPEQSTTETEQQSTENTAETSMTTESEEATSGSTESGESTTQSIPPGATPCPLGGLTGEQIVLVCPTGFRRHPKYCNIFYQCISEATMEVKILSFSCPENTIFDEAKVQCLPETESSQPCTGVKAGARFYRRVESSSTALMRVEKRETLCPDVGHFPYRDGCSNVFYKCKRDSRDALQGYVYKCPQDFVYWSVSRRCERASRLPMCTLRNSSQKDQIDNNSYSSRWQLPVESYNLSARMLRYPY